MPSSLLRAGHPPVLSAGHLSFSCVSRVTPGSGPHEGSSSFMEDEFREGNVLVLSSKTRGEAVWWASKDLFTLKGGYGTNGSLFCFREVECLNPVWNIRVIWYSDHGITGISSCCFALLDYILELDYRQTCLLSLQTFTGSSPLTQAGLNSLYNPGIFHFLFYLRGTWVNSSCFI